MPFPPHKSEGEGLVLGVARVQVRTGVSVEVYAHLQDELFNVMDLGRVMGHLQDGEG